MIAGRVYLRCGNVMVSYLKVLTLLHAVAMTKRLTSVSVFFSVNKFIQTRHVSGAGRGGGAKTSKVSVFNDCMTSPAVKSRGRLALQTGPG